MCVCVCVCVDGCVWVCVCVCRGGGRMDGCVCAFVSYGATPTYNIPTTYTHTHTHPKQLAALSTQNLKAAGWKVCENMLKSRDMTVHTYIYIYIVCVCGRVYTLRSE
jgi:hypothetical protein